MPIGSYAADLVLLLGSLVGAVVEASVVAEFDLGPIMAVEFAVVESLEAAAVRDLVCIADSHIVRALAWLDLACGFAVGSIALAIASFDPHVVRRVILETAAIPPFETGGLHDRGRFIEQIGVLTRYSTYFCFVIISLAYGILTS